MTLHENVPNVSSFFIPSIFGIFLWCLNWKPNFCLAKWCQLILHEGEWDTQNDVLCDAVLDNILHQMWYIFSTVSWCYILSIIRTLLFLIPAIISLDIKQIDYQLGCLKGDMLSFKQNLMVSRHLQANIYLNAHWNPSTL